MKALINRVLISSHAQEVAAVLSHMSQANSDLVVIESERLESRSGVPRSLGNFCPIAAIYRDVGRMWKPKCEVQITEMAGGFLCFRFMADEHLLILSEGREAAR